MNYLPEDRPDLRVVLALLGGLRTVRIAARKLSCAFCPDSYTASCFGLPPLGLERLMYDHYPTR